MLHVMYLTAPVKIYGLKCIDCARMVEVGDQVYLEFYHEMFKHEIYPKCVPCWRRSFHVYQKHHLKLTEVDAGHITSIMLEVNSNKDELARQLRDRVVEFR